MRGPRAGRDIFRTLLGVSLFIAFWVVLALVVFFVAGVGRRGRPEAGRPDYKARRAMGGLLIIIYVGFGVAIPLLFVHGNDANANRQVGGIPLNAAERTGREIFAFRCGFCHTLAAANVVGKVGPNLDNLNPHPTVQLILHTIENGCLQSPPSKDPQEACLGEGTMPAGIIQGQQANQVAAFVAAVAGRE